MQVIWNQLYNKSSCSDRGTLVQLKHLINRRNVPADPKVNFNACDDFLTAVVKAHLLVLVMKHLGMTSFEDEPQDTLFDGNIWMKPSDERKKILYELCKTVLTKHLKLEFITKQSNPKSRDLVLEYADELVTLGMLFLNYRDAVQEGDGLRVLTVWKHLLPILRYSNRRNYSIEVLLTLYQYYFVFSPRQASQFLWSRFVNTRGLPSKNKAGDLHMEHLNRLCKECISGLGANKTPAAITRIGRAMGPLKKVLDSFDDTVEATKVSGSHKISPMEIDIKKVTSDLLTSSIFDKQEGRFHTLFPTFQPVLSHGNTHSYEKWMKSHIELWMNS